MIVRFLAARSGGQQEEVGRVIYEGAEVQVTGKLDAKAMQNDIFGGDPGQLDQNTILQALLECPKRYDGLYFRAEIVSDT